jgi:hypothetical protein
MSFIEKPDLVISKDVPPENNLDLAALHDD